MFQGCYVEEPDRDGYRNTSLNVRGGYALAEALSLEGHVLDAASRTQYDGNIFGGNEADNRQQVFGGRLLWTPGEAVRLALQAGRSNDRSDTYFADNGARSHVGTFDTRRDTASVQGDLMFAAGQRLSAGVDWQKDTVTSIESYAVDHRDNTGVFVEYQGRFGAHALQASVRNDDNEQFGNHTTGSLGYGVALGSGLRLTASAGTGFKAPTFNDLYFPWSSNPELDPEKSKSVNLGIAQYRQGWNWIFNAYETRVDQLIALDSTFTPYNTARGRIRGAELTGFLALVGFDINAQASVTDPRDRTRGTASYDNWLARRARINGRLDIDRGFGPLRVGLTAAGSGQRFDNAANSVRLAGYGTVDLRVEYRLEPAGTGRQRVRPQV
nr:TonB-dependent receptor [Stenotrophomonas mori]